MAPRLGGRLFVSAGLAALTGGALVLLPGARGLKTQLQKELQLQEPEVEEDGAGLEGGEPPEEGVQPVRHPPRPKQKQKARDAQHAESGTRGHHADGSDRVCQDGKYRFRLRCVEACPRGYVGKSEGAAGRECVEEVIVGDSERWHGFCTCPTWSGCPRQKKLWEAAVSEQRLSPADLTKEQCDVPKLPRSWVRKVLAMSQTKVHTFNFIGSLTPGTSTAEGSTIGSGKSRRRQWVLPFMRKYFGDHDYYRDAAAPAHYHRIGAFDKTVVKDRSATFEKGRPMGSDAFDPRYFHVLCGSNFTLAPGGDAPYSLRFYEAILCSSIPVIHNQAGDWSQVRWNGARNRLAPVTSIPYHYYELNPADGPPLDMPLVYRRDWAEENLKLFLARQTFLDPDATLAEAKRAPADDDADDADEADGEDEDEDLEVGSASSTHCAIRPSEDLCMDCD